MHRSTLIIVLLLFQSIAYEALGSIQADPKIDSLWNLVQSEEELLSGPQMLDFKIVMATEYVTQRMIA
jgi:hypothetical protein